MKYRITGASRTTGEDVDITVDAMTRSGAEKKANAKGMMVTNIETVHSAGTSTPPPASENVIAVRLEGVWHKVGWVAIVLMVVNIIVGMFAIYASVRLLKYEKQATKQLESAKQQMLQSLQGLTGEK